MGWWFGYARLEGFPTMYPEMRTPVTVDVLEAGFILAFVILATSFYVVMPGTKGKLYRWNVFMRATLKILAGAILMDEPKPASDLEHEVIDYNERFWWTWDQGRFGFGPYAGLLQQSFRDAQRRGLPVPILEVVDYFTWDGEGLRFGRHYRTAGWYTHILLWAAFPCWILANFFFMSSVRYAAVFTCLTGLLQLLACVTWASIRNSVPLVIPFEGGHITMSYGPNFYLNLFGGCLCTGIGALLLLLDCRFPDEVSTFFGIDPLAEYEEYHLTAEELSVVRRSHKRKNSQLNLVVVGDGNMPSPDPLRTQAVLKRRATILPGQKSLYRTPNLDTELYQDVCYADDDAPQYQNIQRARQPPYTLLKKKTHRRVPAQLLCC